MPSIYKPAGGVAVTPNEPNDVGTIRLRRLDGPRSNVYRTVGNVVDPRGSDKTLSEPITRDCRSRLASMPGVERLVETAFETRLHDEPRDRDPSENQCVFKTVEHRYRTIRYAVSDQYAFVSTCFLYFRIRSVPIDRARP